MPRIFSKRDWSAFGITSLVVFTVYLFTLGSDLDLESSGIYATAAMHAGVGCPPGYPQWTICAWLFVHVVPFGNIAWRISLSSAMTGALASGLIALVGCRFAALVVEQLAPSLSMAETNRVPVVAGCVGAMAFAFSTDFWARSVTVDVQAFNILLFSIVLALMTHWIFQPTQRTHLYAAFFFYGLTVTSGQSFISTAFGMQFLVILGNRALGRDLLLMNSVLLLVGFVLKSFGWFPALTSSLLILYVVVTVVVATAAAILIVRTREALSEWRTVLIACTLMTLAAMTYFIVPLLSMTNPPANWAYPRTVDGFFHLLTRGQFERLNPTSSPLQFLKQMQLFGAVAWDDFGWYYLAFAAASLFVLKRLERMARGLIIVLFIIFGKSTILMTVVLNPSLDRQTLGLIKTYFTPSYVILSLLTAIGLASVAALVSERSTKLSPDRF